MKTDFIIRRVLDDTAYARNGNAHNPTKYYRWEILDRETRSRVCDCRRLREAKECVKTELRGTFTIER